MPAVPVLRRILSVKLAPLPLNRGAACIAKEVIQHLTSVVVAEVEITLELRARRPEGPSNRTVRDVSENWRALRFTDFGFEEE